MVDHVYRSSSSQLIDCLFTFLKVFILCLQLVTYKQVNMNLSFGSDLGIVTCVENNGPFHIGSYHITFYSDCIAYFLSILVRRVFLFKRCNRMRSSKNKNNSSSSTFQHGIRANLGFRSFLGAWVLRSFPNFSLSHHCFAASSLWDCATRCGSP
jgi:hypothetical protein